MAERSFNLVVPLAHEATAMRITDTAGSSRAASSAVSPLIGASLRQGDVDSTNGRSTPLDMTTGFRHTGIAAVNPAVEIGVSDRSGDKPLCVRSAAFLSSGVASMGGLGGGRASGAGAPTVRQPRFSAAHPDWRQEAVRNLNRSKHTMSKSKGNLKHGGHGTLTYARWKSMMARCYQVNAENYQYYGARGITVCEQWHDFAAFLADMGECPDRSMTVDRVKNEIGYQPGNCRWATKANQNRNRPSHQVLLTHNGKTQNVTAWAAETGMSANAINQRLYLGWGVERALTTPLKARTVKRCLHGVLSSRECPQCDREIEATEC